MTRDKCNKYTCLRLLHVTAVSEDLGDVTEMLGCRAAVDAVDGIRPQLLIVALSGAHLQAGLEVAAA